MIYTTTKNHYILGSIHYRFASDLHWPYWVMNMKDRQTISTQIGVVCYQKNLLEKLEDVEFIEKEFSKGFNSSYVKQFSSRVANLQGTRPYWFYHTKNLIAGMDEFRSPTMFFSASAADYQWVDLQRFMPHPPDTNLDQLTVKDKKKKVVENPHIATWFFCKKFELIMDRLIPILGIKHYWYRVESQGRGSHHIHGALWLKDAPDLCVLSNEVKLGYIASQKLDTIYGENDNNMRYSSNDSIWFEDKKELVKKTFTNEEIVNSEMLMEFEKIKFMNALDRDIQQQQNSKYKDDLRFNFFFFLCF